MMQCSNQRCMQSWGFVVVNCHLMITISAGWVRQHQAKDGNAEADTEEQQVAELAAAMEWASLVQQLH